jgi:cytochrome P450
MGGPLPPRVDILDPELLLDPYPALARLRAGGPVWRAGPGMWAVTRHGPVAALLRDPGVGHQLPPELRRLPVVPAAEEDGLARLVAATQPNRDLAGIVSGLDPPQQTRVRRLVGKALSPEVISGALGRIHAHAGELVATAVERGRMDAVADFALPLQTAVTCDLLGIPAADRDEVCSLATALGRALIALPFVTEDRGNGSEEARALRGYVGSLVTERRRRGGGDVIARMLAAGRGAGALTDEEVIDNAVFLFFAGFETSIHLLAGGIAALTAFPDELERLRGDRSLLATAVEEILRYDAPLQWVTRTTLRRVDIEGTELRAGRVVLLLLASANRDDRVFRDPDRLDVGRHPNPHLSFGGGVHHCLGVGLARAQGAAALDRLLGLAGDLEPLGPPVLRPHPNVRGYARVEVAVRPPRPGRRR